MKRLEISTALSLPVEAVTQTIVVYGSKGMGKTNFGSVFAEELFRAGQRFSVIDPMGVWWGLQHGREKSQPGIEVLLLGGVHGDLPIEPTAGEVVADLVADERISVVIDISRRADGKAWTKGEKVRFTTAYMMRLYERQVEHRRPLMQIIDEAARYAPQGLRSGDVEEAKALGAIAMVCEEGRNLGIGMTLLTQRSARLNKDVAELADVLVAFRTVGPNSVGAITDWLGDHVARERHKSIVEQLRQLPVGTALVISPGWLGFEGVVPMRARQTFDSSATPKTGGALEAPGRATKPDLDKYRERMAATIERAKSADPREQKRQIIDLQKQVAALQQQLAKKDSVTAAKAETKTVEVQVIKPAEMKRVEGALAKLSNLAERLERERDKLTDLSKQYETARSEVHDECDELKALLERATRPQPPASLPSPVVARTGVRATNTTSPPARRIIAPLPSQSVVSSIAGDLVITSTQQRILNALAWYEFLGNFEPSNLQIGAVALIDATGGHFSNVVGPLSSAGLIKRGDGRMHLTDAGRAQASVPEQVATLDDYHDVLRARVRKVKSASQRTVDILDRIIARGGLEVTTEEIGQEVGIDHTGGHFSNTIGPLGTLGLIERDRGLVRPTEILFPEGLD